LTGFQKVKGELEPGESVCSEQKKAGKPKSKSQLRSEPEAKELTRFLGSFRDWREKSCSPNMFHEKWISTIDHHELNSGEARGTTIKKNIESERMRREHFTEKLKILAVTRAALITLLESREHSQ